MSLPRATVRVTPDRSVFTGETVTLKCEIEDQYRSLNWRYLWYKNTTKVFNSGRYTLNRDSLTIRGVTESDQDEFRCSTGIHGRPQTLQSSSAAYLTVKGSKPKLTSNTEGSVLTGNTVTLKCHIDHWSTEWKFYWYNNTQNTEKTTTATNSYTIHSVKVSDGGQYWCRAGRGKPDYYTDYSDGLWINVTESPKPVVSVDPDKQLFRGETVTLRCDIQDTGDTEWTYSWTVKKTNNRNIITQCNTQECKINNIQPTDSGKYTCRGKIREQNTEMSDAVTLTVSSGEFICLFIIISVKR
ncbi:high affinity immunoglobulin gamma Fc receptor I-like [Paramisgurnus dabryanus]|uniref:high affinity immunoglobulin gamma Fc receptor I-like n=1 Tax=Paramisgurnus dabryanus TaxID=90735 RepID=UPI003CCF94DF